VKKLLYITNVDWFFISHRLPIAKEAINQGYDVALACNFTGREDEIRAHGIRIYDIPLSRSGINIFKELSSFISIVRVLKVFRPDIIHAITIKPVIYGSLAAKLLSIKRRVFSISGLGFIYIDHGIKARILKKIAFIFYKFGLNNKSSSIIFQNDDDKKIFLESGITNYFSTHLIKGSGINLIDYKFIPINLNEDPPIIMFISRLLKDKGLIEFCKSAKLLKSKNFRGRFVVIGDADLNNPNSISVQELQEYKDSKIIEHWGFKENISQEISKSLIIVLPSYREGFPKVLIEASSVGRPIITTDVPGCRDAIIENITGIKVPVKSIIPLADSIQTLAEDKSKCIEMGKAGRRYAEKNFNINQVIEKHLDIYKRG